MFKSKVPLVEFYEHLLPIARAVGYKMVLTAVAREADAPAFYDDLKRYWSSLHDATGPDILFVFAGANAAEEFDEHGLSHAHQPVAVRSDQLAFQGFHEKKWKMHWNGRVEINRDPPSLLNPDRARWMETVGRYRAYLEENDSLSRDHTLEIYSLSRFLGLRESDLPCLLFTLLKPGQDTRFKQVSLSLNRLTNTTIYLFVKRLAENFEDLFKSADKFQQQIRAKQRQAARAEREFERAREPLRRAEAVRSSVRYYAEKLPSEAAVAVAKILELIDSPDQIGKTRSECYREFQKVKAVHPLNVGIIPELQRLIDLTFSDRTGRDLTQAENVQEVTALLGHLRRLESEQVKHWSLLEQKLEELADFGCQDAHSQEWDFFVAYSSPDRSIAERAFSELSTVGRTFLDSRCLRPGDRWTERIRSAQDTAKCTVLIITEGTPNGWFTESEYLHAIQLARIGHHVVIPVLFGKQAQLPYGLEQIQAARINEWTELKRLPELVKHVVQTGGKS